MKALSKEININKKFIVIFILLNLIMVGMYSSYALFEMTVIKDSIIVIKTASIDIITKIDGYSTPTITLAKGATTTVKVNLTNDLKRDIAYKMYYKLTSGSNTLTFKTDEDFETNKVEGVMNTSRSINLIFTNTGSSSVTFTLGTKGGVKGFDVILDQGVEIPLTPRELVAGATFNKSVKDLVNNTTTATEETADTKITYIGFYENELPEGYTEETLKSLPHVAVSLDTKVKAYNDNGKVYVYSKNDIVANQVMSSMFREMNSLTSIDLLDLDTSNVTHFLSTFRGLTKLTSIDVSKLNTAKVTNMQEMFYGCSSLTSLDVSNFNTSNVNTMLGMFAYCSGLTSLDLSNFNTAKVTSMQNMFGGCSNLTTLDVSGFNTAKVTSMYTMFNGCKKLTNLNVSGFNTANVTQMGEMFRDCSSLTSLDVSGFNTAKVTSMKHMFNGCSNLTTLDVSGFNTAKTASFAQMFANCTNLSSIDISNFNTNSLTEIYFMFAGCKSLVNIDISHFNLTKVGNLNSLFSGCTKLKTVNLSNLNTSNITSFREMFDNCSSLETLDLSSFDTSKVTSFREMFDGASGLKTVYVSEKWTTANVTDDTNMLRGVLNIIGGNGTKYNSSYIDSTYARIDTASTPGYFTLKQ